jgi:hypothetical protein
MLILRPHTLGVLTIMWLAIVPLIVIGFFLLITWEVLSPVQFVKQHIETRKQRQILAPKRKQP